MKKFFTVISICFFASVSAVAEDYWVTQYRAAPGNFPALLELVKTTDWQALDNGRPIFMRHSQGNHWDLMLLSTPCASSACLKSMREFGEKTAKLVDFELSFLAWSDTNWKEVHQQADSAGLFHIEMFHAAAGKNAALQRQRRIENAYLAATGQKENIIFRVHYGSDIDMFTIGFHESLSSFASQGPSSSEAAEKAAVEAGFKNRADISFHLRELIVGHHDTLAVPVK